MNIIDKAVLRFFRIEDMWRENRHWLWLFIGAGAFFGVFAYGLLLAILQGHLFLTYFFGIMMLVIPALMAWNAVLVRRMHARQDKVR